MDGMSDYSVCNICEKPFELPPHSCEYGRYCDCEPETTCYDCLADMADELMAEEADMKETDHEDIQRLKLKKYQEEEEKFRRQSQRQEKWLPKNLRKGRE